ncbi:ABC transporter permease [Gordonia sinesedis]
MSDSGGGVTISKSRPEYLAYEARKQLGKPLKVLDGAGEQMSFYGRAVLWIPRTITHYTKEVLRILAEVTFGVGGLAVIGGTVGIMVLMTAFTGVVVGLQAFAALNTLGSQALTGFLNAYINTREVAPLIAGLSLSATVGCGFTAQLGAMRISEEIDALETMAVPSVPFLVTTRVIAGFVAVIPLYVIGLLSAYLASRLVTTLFNGQSGGSYDHYFNLFLPPVDVLWSFGKVLIFAFVIILVHCYYGYYASGGPAGVGVAVGYAVRAALVLIAVLDFFLGLAIWGTTTTIRVGG